MIKQIEKLSPAARASGCEQEIRALILERASLFADDVYIDSMGNLIAHKTGKGKKTALVASMDGAGLMITHISDNGELRFAPVGEPELGGLLYSRVVFQSGLKGIVAPEKPCELSAVKMSALVIDIGAKDKASAQEEVCVGDIAWLDTDLLKLCDRLAGANLAASASCAILLTVLENCRAVDDDLYFVFAAQGALGNRGAKAALNLICPESVIAVGAIAAKKENPSLAPGSGAVIKLKDKGMVYSSFVVERLLSCAASEKIKHKAFAGEDDCITPSDGCAMSGAVGFALSFSNTSNEMLNLNDTSEVAKLLTQLFRQGDC